MSLSAKGRRNKGVAGEREVRQTFEEAGFEARGLEDSGDHLIVITRDELFHALLHVESKRQEKIRILEWSRQAEAERPPATVAVVAFRPSREPWRVSLRLDDFIDLIR